MLFGQENELLIHAIVRTKFENSMKHYMKEASHKKNTQSIAHYMTF